MDDKKLCPRYTARIIRNVKVGPSPAWLVEKLESMGLRPVNNIVDITNFCLIELGEPMHAFDLDKLAGQSIVVRAARGKEKITTIDGIERELDASILVIADSERPVAVAGVMGGLDTEVSSSTKTILLEAAIFDPVSVRRTSRKLGLSTESSYRFERRIDPDIVKAASDRAAQLILKLAGGEAGPFVDRGSSGRKKRLIGLRIDRVRDVLGVTVTPPEIKKIFTGLGLSVRSASTKKFAVAVGGWRGDLTSEIDLIEEVARIYGIGNIPVTTPEFFEQPTRISDKVEVERIARDYLNALGLDEIITYSLVSSRVIDRSGIGGEEALSIANPLSAEQEVMRPSLVPGLLNTVLSNINKGTRDVKCFEIGGVYRKAANRRGFTEEQYVGIAMTGRELAAWKQDIRNCTYFDAKGAVEALFERLGIGDAAFIPGKLPYIAAGSCADIRIGGTSAGYLGRIADHVAGAFDIKQEVFAAELRLSALLGRVNLSRRYKKPPVYPSVTRDISIVVENRVSNASVIKCIRGEGGSLVKETRPFDRYTGEQIPEGKKNLTYRVEYLDPAKTLEDAEVNEVHSRICGALARELGATFR
ncbi:MAG: phenylalanine--tRNA ligase subunit beta [Candidatus Omnitrophota bacterium]